MNRASTYRHAAPMAQDAEPRTSAALAGSLLLLGVSYLLLIAAPVVSQRFDAIAGRTWDVALLQRWLPAAAGSGLALGGGSALVFVLARLVKDVERRPYACLAPVLAVFSGCVLLGLRAKLPLAGIGSEPICVFALALAVVGGALVQERTLLAQITGWALALLPSLSLVGVVWAASGKREWTRAVWATDPQARVFLLLLGISSVAIAMVAVVARSLSREAPVARAAASGSAASAITPVFPLPGPREDTLELDLDDEETAFQRRVRPRWLWPLVATAGAALVGLVIVRAWPRASDPVESLTAAPAAAPAVTPEKSASAEQRAEESRAAEAALRALIEGAHVEQLGAPAPKDTKNAVSTVEQHPVAAPAASRETMLSETVIEAPTPQEAARPLTGDAVAPKERSIHKGKVARHRTRTPAARAVSRAREPVEAAAPAPKPHKEPAKPEVAAKPAAKPEVAAKPAAKPAAPAAPADDSLDALMDRVVDKEKVKANIGAADDPIFGL